MNERIKELAKQVDACYIPRYDMWQMDTETMEKFAELIVRECINHEELLGAIARGWCSEKNSHKTMDPDLAIAIAVGLKKHFGVEE